MHHVIYYNCLPPAPPQASHRWLPRPPHSQRTVLVTGVAGFIGFHVARELTRQWGPSTVVVGVDIFSEYYDVQLKQDRASELLRHGVIIYRADVCDRTFLSHLFTSYNFTDVVHMAAQAGVRHSMRDPTAYVRANVQCFLALLDSLKGRKVCEPCLGSLVTALYMFSSHVFANSHVIIIISWKKLGSSSNSC